jgi:hypothetical protein
MVIFYDHYTVGENIIATIKMRNNLCLYFCMSYVVWFMASFLYCFPYNCRSFTLLKALAKSNGTLMIILIAIAFKSDNFRKEAIKQEAKNWYQKGCKED